MLEQLRRRLRQLVPLIERSKKSVIYSDFEDDIGIGVEVGFKGVTDGVSVEFAQFRKKAQHYLKQHLDEPTVAKVRSGQPLSSSDLAELQRILESAGIGGNELFALATESAGNFGLFIRSLVGMDRAAAKQAFVGYLDEQRYSKNQIQFINEIINYLTEHGVLEKGRIYQSPFIAFAPTGPDDLFGSADVDRIFEVLDGLVTVAA